jgi:hypothetical protein
MLSKYYSLDECYNRDVVLDYLDNLQDMDMIIYQIVESDLFRLKDVGLSEKQIKELINFFDENDVIDSEYYDVYDEDDSDEGDSEDGDYLEDVNKKD